MKANLRVHFNKTNDMSERWVETVEVDIREPTRDDAPLAVESSDGRTRWFEGRHFRQYTLFSYYYGHPDGETDAAAILDYLQNADHPSALGYTTNGYPDATNPRDGDLTHGWFSSRPESKDRKFSTKRYPDIVDDPERVKQVSGAHTFAHNCIIVDGKLWVACAEPKLVVGERVYVDFRHRLLSGLHGNDMNEVRPTIGLLARSYRLDEAEVAFEAALASGGNGALPELAVHIPDSIQWDRQRDNLVAAAKLLLGEWAEPLLEIHPNIGTSLFEIGRVLWKKEDHDIDVETLADAMANSLRIHTALGYDVPAYLKISLDWENRPITAPTLGGSPSPWQG